MKKQNLTRRNLLQGLGVCALAGSTTLGSLACERSKAADLPKYHLAKYWEAGEGRTVECKLCPVGCTVAEGDSGHCRARKNIDGKYYAMTYGRPVAIHNDPIEKKPFNHFLPGTNAMSFGLVGCNLRCRHCQNWQISQAEPGQLRERDISPKRLVELTRSAGSPTMAFTYNEPTTFPEYILDCAVAGKSQGIGAVVISNGYINEQPQKDLAAVLRGYKIDLKGFTEKFYEDVCGASLRPVQDSLVRLKKLGVWVEIVNLVIPTLNDDENDFQAMSKWIASELGPDVPIHFTRFHPMYKIRNLPPTPVSTLEKAREIAASHGIRYAYVGNVMGHKWEHTYCHQCGKMLIERVGFAVDIKGMENGKCKSCGSTIPGVWV